MVDVIQAYDSHCNLVLGDVEETIYVVDEDEDEDTSAEEVKVCSCPLSLSTIPSSIHNPALRPLPYPKFQGQPSQTIIRRLR